MNVNNSIAEETPQEEFVLPSLDKLSKSSMIVFVGMMIGMAFGFLSRIVIARLSSPEQLGVFSIGLGLVNTFAGIAMLGLQQGTARYVAFYFGKQDAASVRSIIRASVEMCVVSSVVAMGILYFGSDFFAEKLLHNRSLSPYLKVFSCSIGFIVLSNLLIAIFRGANRPESKAIFDDILRNSLFLVISSILLIIGFAFISVIWAHLIAAFLTFVSLLLYYVTKPFILKHSFTKAHLSTARKELISYSLPLLMIVVVTPLFASLDTLILGYFNKPNVVGYYNAIYPIANLIPVLMSAAAFTMFPFFCQLYAKAEIEKINRIYKQITKLLIVSSFPLFLVFFIFSKSIIILFFGTQYIPSYLALRIIVLGTFLLITMGPTDIVLQAAGKTKFLMYAGLAGFFINVCLNFIFIPWLGMIGAAIAYLLGRNTIYLIQSIKINKLMNMHFFDFQHVKILTILSCIIVLAYLLAGNNYKNYMVILIFLAFFFPAYIGILFGFKIVGHKEWCLLNGIVHGKVKSF